MQGNPFDEPTLPGQGGRFAAGMKILGGRFVLERQLGRGGMGEVWLARDAELGDHRALKFLPGEVAHDPKALSQLRREAAAGQRLSHPRIVKTHDLHVDGGHAAVAMEYVEGKTLNELQAEIEKGYFEVAEIAGWIKDVCEALAYAHGEAKVVHRDLKPPNIIIEKATGRAKVLDFGISRRISEAHTQITGKDSSGTMAYSSPQQMDGDKGVPSDDLYALGATLYELLTGSPPFFRGDLRKQILEKVPPSMTERRAELAEEGMILEGGQPIPSNWEQGVADCLSKEPNKRPPDAMALWQGLSREKTREEEAGSRREELERQRLVLEQQIEADKRAREEADARKSEASRRRVGDNASPAQEAAAERAAVMPVASPRKNATLLPLTIGACVLMGLVAWGVVSSNKPAATRTVTVTDDAAIQRERDKAEAAAALARDAEQRADKAEQERQALKEQAREKELADAKAAADARAAAASAEAARAKQAEQQRLADLADAKAVNGFTASKETPFVNSLGMKFVPVVITGGPTSGKKVLFSIWETRVKDYEVYAAANSRVDMSWKSPGFTQADEHPVTCVSWEDAVAFCAWLTKKERASGKIGPDDTYRLPTDAEWSYAVGIGEKEDASKTPKEKARKIADVYPWGTSWPPPKGVGNFCGQETKGKSGSMIDGYEDGYMTTAPVGSFDKNDRGLYDLSGNVWEWCDDCYAGKSGSPVLRGGSWSDSGPRYLLSSDRGYLGPGSRDVDYGFRCVLVVSAR
jgi:serine/threonine protein kinase/formylglycine-generating enzyme required for sulfatase activity